jgi:hypothetical protein
VPRDLTAPSRAYIMTLDPMAPGRAKSAICALSPFGCLSCQGEHNVQRPADSSPLATRGESWWRVRRRGLRSVAELLD